jgi:hypothetical protein
VFSPFDIPYALKARYTISMLDRYQPGAGIEFRRTNQQAQSHGGSAAPVPQPALPQPKGSRTKFVLLIMVLLVFLIAVAAGLFWYFRLRPVNPLAKEMEHASFVVYYPTYIPKNYKLDHQSYEEGPGYISYYARSPGGDKVLFIVQPRPQSGNIEDIQKKIWKDTSTGQTDYGATAVGTNEGKAIGSLSGASLAIVSAPSSVSKAEMTKIIEGLKPSR